MLIMNKCPQILLNLLILFITLFFPPLQFETNARNIYYNTRKSLDIFLNRYKGTTFESIISLGDRKVFYEVLNKSRIEIDKSYCQKKDIQGAAVPYPVTKRWALILKYDPSKVPQNYKDDFDLTLWHESLHLIEYSRGDFDGDKAWEERHTEYAEILIKNVLDPLKELEKNSVNAQIPDHKLFEEWRRIVDGYNDGAKKKNSTYPTPPDMATFEKWFKIRIKLSEIEKHYRSGAGGSRMKKIVESVFLESIQLNSLKIKQYPRRLDDNHTTYDLSFDFKLNPLSA